MEISSAHVPGYFNCYHPKIMQADANFMGVQLLLYLDGETSPHYQQEENIKMSPEHFSKIGASFLIIPKDTYQVNHFICCQVWNCTSLLPSV